MKNIWIIPFVITGIVKQSVSVAQINLVPNPSFEDSSGCPLFISQIYLADGWSSYRESADYFHTCGDPNGLGIPVNGRGSQFAFGEAYAGIACFHRTVSNLREYMGIQLLQSLIPGQKYFISLHVSLADTNGFNCASNKIGVKFSTVQFTTSTPAPITNSAHVFSNNIIADKINWTQINGSFIADSAYQYLMIGNFFDDANTDTSTCFLYSYFYVDKICTSTDSLTCAVLTLIDEKNISGLINVFPNPANDYLLIKAENIQINSIEIYDLLGQIISDFNFKNEKHISISVKNLSQEIYILKIYTNKGTLIKKIQILK